MELRKNIDFEKILAIDASKDSKIQTLNFEIKNLECFQQDNQFKRRHKHDFVLLGMHLS